MRRPSGMIIVCSVLLGAVPSPLYSHPGHIHDAQADASGLHADERFMLALAEQEPAPAAASSQPGITGQGKFRFRVLYKSDHLPEKAVEVLKSAHGGFAVDRREGKGDIYFALPGAGIIQISGDLKKTKLLDTDAAVRDTNQHNTMIWYDKEDKPYLTFPGNEVNTVFTTDIEGKLIHALPAPTTNDDLGQQAANDYFKDPANKFVPTDVEQLDGLYYIPTGYSKLDYVLTAKITLDPFKAVWNNLSFGGKGDEPGQFQTGHGITVPKGEKRLDVADRPKAEIDRFSPDGKYLETVKLPEGSYPCDVSYEGKRAVVGCLVGPNKEKGAPIYILEDDKVVSTLMPKDDLGLENFKHVHNAIGVTIKKKMYVIAQAWNPGDFAILEQVSE